MDPFTQRMLEKAEQRSKALGISKAKQFPSPPKQENRTQVFKKPAATTSSSVCASPLKQNNSTTSASKINVVQKKVESICENDDSSTDKVRRQFSVDKENVDLGIEINITTAKDVEVQVQVEEQDTSDDNDASKNSSVKPAAIIRETSRTRLQRLGALYSNNEISSPIHRTEAKFYEGTDNVETSPKRPKQRFGKLVALADSINSWENDTTHHDIKSVDLKPVDEPPTTSSAVKTTPRDKPQIVEHKLKEKNPPSSDDGCNAPNSKSSSKQLKWDQKIMDSLEAQGFQRRESKSTKLAYEYGLQPESNSDKEKPKPLGKSDKPTSSNASAIDEKKPVTIKSEKLTPSVKPGLVSGRAAAFESKTQNMPQAKPQKDPTELSLKERMELFEKNKGEALIPKAPFGMAPPISKIRQDKKVTDTIAATKHAVEEYNKASVAVVKSTADRKVRSKVAALVANASSTMAESRIKAEITKQRQEDMQVIANRFNKPKEHFKSGSDGKKDNNDHDDHDDAVDGAATVNSQKPNSNSQSSMVPPPPPPPMIPGTISSYKRRSPGNGVDEIKRARKSTEEKQKSTGSGNRLYPALSDLESNGSDNDNCTTATVSAEECHRKGNQLDESYMDSEDDSTAGICNVSLGREIMQVVQSNESQQKNAASRQQEKGVRYAEKDEYYGDSSINSSEDGSMGGVDDYLDEAFDGNDDDDDTDEHNDSKASRTSKGTTASNSFSFKKTQKKYTHCMPISEEGDDYQTTSTPVAPHTTPVKSALTVNQSEDENMVTLVHTVSFYRRQQNSNSNNSTPIRRICREHQVMRSAMGDGAGGGDASYNVEHSGYHQHSSEQFYSEDESSSESEMGHDSHLVQDKIKKLLDEVCKQQQVIGQTSQALNLCASTIEFSGSTESVEGERHLLVATHRRQAALDEIQRLRVEGSVRPLGAPKEKGRLTIKEITIPLRHDYIRKLSADTISGHHLVCLLKYNEHVLATKTVPTLPGLVAVKFPDVLQLNNVYADFRVTLEIYGMTAQREVLPHEVKYHINLNKKGGNKTPKKKGNDNRLVMPIVQSPAGPNVVRTPALVQYGFAIFSLREIQRTTWSLTQVLGVSPLDGVVHMKVDCELSVSVDHKGFLTMFEDISGFGAWHRRWCHLNGHVVNYWKYPDDEKKKAPMGTIDLSACCTTKVTTAPRDICARLNTMLLECQRPARDDDTESLLIVPNGKMTIVRQLLSADTKEEREEWCAYFNKALTLLRAWGGRPQQ